MLGLVFTLVADEVVEEYGHDVWDDLLEAAGTNGSYTSIGLYPDDEFGRIVAAAAERFELSKQDVLRATGRCLMRALGTHHADVMDQEGFPQFLDRLSESVHSNVMLEYPSASPPVLAVLAREAGRVRLRYESGRRLCHLAEGMLVEAGRQFGLDVTVEQDRCSLVDATHCELVVRW